MPANLEQKLEIRRGPLAEILPLFDVPTLQHAHEIISSRRDDESLKDQWFWTADFPMYRLENGEPMLYLARAENNLILRDVQNVRQLIEYRFIPNYYTPTKEGINEVIAAADSGKALKVKLSDLRLELDRDLDERGYLEIHPNKVALNPTERKLAEWVYGKGAEFAENMESIRYKFNGLGIHILGPRYIKRHLKGKEERAIARLSRLGISYIDPSFHADVDDDYSRNGGLRGVILEVPKVSPKTPKKRGRPPLNVFD